MNEAFLHHLWKFRLYDKSRLATTDGEVVEVIKTGQHNTDAGPDFFNAQVKIGNTTWAGNVEIHLRSSDWNRHQHANDAAYNNVVLHVVHEHDQEIETKRKTKITTLELRGRYNQELFQNYLNLVEGNRWIPCEDHIRNVDRMILSAFLERMAIERLEIKTNGILDTLRLNKNNWEETFYQHLARNFGFKTNSLPFELLAKSLPLQVLGKHKDRLLQVESLLFGQAGMLEREFRERYGMELKKEYEFLRKKYSLEPIELSQWKFLRLRPSNFPTIRIAQFAQLMHKNANPFSMILEAASLEGLTSPFMVPVSAYWESHYTFDHVSVNKMKSLGQDTAESILINSVVPFLFAYGKYRSEEAFLERALKFLEQLPAEKNSIISKWGELGIPAAHAGFSQALIQLKNEYCNRKKCLFCTVGNKLINSIP